MTVINTNIKALYTQSALKSSERASQSAMQQLSTGKRINSSKDDAAGLAIAARMTQNIKGMNVLLAYKIATLQPEDAYSPEIRRGLLSRRRAIPWHVAGETPPLSSYVVDAPRSERMTPYVRTNSDRD